jgi:hypothetical protein
MEKGQEVYKLGKGVGSTCHLWHHQSVPRNRNSPCALWRLRIGHLNLFIFVRVDCTFVIGVVFPLS